MPEFDRITRLPPYVFNITTELKMAARRRGEDIIDFGMGNPDGPTPQHIVDKLIETVRRPDTHGYSVSKGIPRLRAGDLRLVHAPLRRRIRPRNRSHRDHRLEGGHRPPGARHARPSDTVLVPNPSYPIHIYGPVIAGADIRHVPITPDVDFFVELEQAIHTSFPKPKMLIINFPSNPTAQCVELPFFEKIVALARQNGIYVVHDLAYADIVFDGWKAPSIMQVAGARDVAVEFFTMSKSYNMAGWRVGFMVGNKDLVNALARIKSYHDYGMFTPIQVASIAALDGPQECVAEIATKYQDRRDVLVKGLHEAGWMVENPEGVDVRVGEDSGALPRRRLARIREAAAREGEGLGVAGHRLRRVRRRLCPFRADREQRAHAAGGPRHQADVPRRRPRGGGVSVRRLARSAGAQITQRRIGQPC